MIKRYCWKLFLFFRFYARNDQPGRMKCSSIVKLHRSSSDRERPRKHQGTISAQIFSATAEGRGMYQQEGRNKVKVKDLKPKHIKDYLECKISQRKSKVNPVHVRNQKRELTPPRSRCQESDSSTVEGIVYKQAEQLFGLRHKPLTLQDALPISESAEKICPGRTRCLLSRHPLCHPVQADYRSP
ncbi:hypothetical protein GQ457_05G022810 [Hibiscus cannabinus]